MNKILTTAAIAIVAVVLYYYYLTTEIVETDELSDENDMAKKYTYSGSTAPATKNFKASEFDCKDGTAVPKQYWGNLYELMINLQVLRDYLGVPIFVNSGFRTQSHNKKEGGAKNSTHLTALGGDIRAVGISPIKVKAAIEHLINTGRMRKGGLKAYATFTHYDVRGYNARW